MLTFGSLFAGIGGFDLALRNAGFKSSFSVEIDRHCNSVRKNHWSDDEQHTDATAFSIRSTERRPDIICAGWPCQGNSVAGKRAGMADERSGLWGEAYRVLSEFTPTWFLGENVPGILSVNGGRDWCTVLRGLAHLGYGFAYRVLDAQWFGVAQRRRRVFIVGCLGNWRRAAEILFESDSLPWNPTPSREAKPSIAGTIEAGSGVRRGAGINPGCLTSHHDRHSGEDTFVVDPLDTKPYADNEAKESRLVVAFSSKDHGADAGDIAPTLRSMNFDKSHINGGGQVAIAYRTSGNCGVMEQGDKTAALNCGTDPNQNIVAYQCHGSNVGPMGTLRKGNGNETKGVPFVMQERMESLNPSNGPNGKGWSQDGVAFTLESRVKPQSVASGMRVRRLTPLECERLQGFPDGWTNGFADSVRYRMLGNAVAVPVVEWIGRRIVEANNAPKNTPR